MDQDRSNDAPLLEFDPDPTAIIEPTSWHRRIDGFPRAAVMTWMRDAYEELIAAWPSREVHRFTMETADNVFVQVELPEGPVIVNIAGVGAPAAVAQLEVLIALGCDTVVAAGSSGGLVAEHPPGSIVVPDDIIRDEGVSYHYAPAARYARPDPDMQSLLRSVLSEAGHAPITGRLWTTDAFFRETTAKVAARVDEGAIAVDMEASAFATVAAFRGIRLGHAVYMADTLHSDAWDPTELVDRDTDFRHDLLRCAARCAALAVS